MSKFLPKCLVHERRGRVPNTRPAAIPPRGSCRSLRARSMVVRYNRTEMSYLMEQLFLQIQAHKLEIRSSRTWWFVNKSPLNCLQKYTLDRRRATFDHTTDQKQLTVFKVDSNKLPYLTYLSSTFFVAFRVYTRLFRSAGDAGPSAPFLTLTTTKSHTS